MNADPLLRLVPVFGDVLLRCRTKRNWTLDVLADASGLSRTEIRGMEAGDYGPSLMEFFRIAEALGEQPVMLLVDVVSAWRADPTDTLYNFRPSDFARLFRLGYHHKPGDFRELPTAYYSVAESTHAAAKLNAQRHTRGVALLDTVCIYVRLDYVSLRSDGGRRTAARGRHEQRVSETRCGARFWSGATCGPR
jgi:transcriptional regulator with XRE-family HTH domain